jgi:hypothetical protein
MLSRLWYLVLALAVGGALAGAFLNKSAASREAEFQLEEQLRRDRVEAELWMRLDARLRLDALASIAVEPEVRQTLRSSSGHAGTTRSNVRRRLSIKLNALNEELEEGRGDMVFAIDTEGEVVATLEKETSGTEQLGKMPLVRDALRGFMRDDVWVYNGEVYRMAARPVFDGGRYVGAIVHGMKVGDELARRLGAKLPNASVVFFHGNQLIASHSGGATALTSSELMDIVPRAVLTMGENPSSIEVGERSRAIASPVRGGASHARVGYLIGRKGSTVGLGGLFANTFKEDVASLPWLLVIGLPLLLLLLGLGVLYLEHDKPVAILTKSSASLQRREVTGLPAGELRRHYRKIAESVNNALRAGVGFKEDAEVRAAVDLDQVLNTTRDGADTGYFGFAAAEAPTAKNVSLDDEPEASPVAPIDPPDGSTPSNDTGSQIAAPPRAATTTARPASSATARPKRTPSSRPKRASSWPSRAPSTRQPAAAAVRQPEDGMTPMLDDPPTRPNALLDDYDGFDHPEENTQVKHVPQSLIAASAPEEDGEEIHFRQVFEKFLATQEQCGAPTNGLTFEKFVRKLDSARSQVMKRHNASAVRFTVYVKDGRAALKASPVKT